MEKLETLAVVLCVSMLAGLAVYTVDLLNVAGTGGLIQHAEAIRRSTHQCTNAIPIIGGCL
jgi:hypothetical protein